MTDDKDIIDEIYEDFFEDEETPTEDTGVSDSRPSDTKNTGSDVEDGSDTGEEDEKSEKNEKEEHDDKANEEEEGVEQKDDSVPNYVDDASSILNVVVGDLRNDSTSVPEISFEGLEDSDEPVNLTASQLKEVLKQVYQVAVESAVKITSDKVQDHTNSVNEGRAFVDSFFRKNPEMREHSKAFSTYVKLTKLENPSLPISDIFGKAHTQFKSEMNVLPKQNKKAVKSVPPARKASAITPPNNTRSNVPDTFAVFYED